MTCLICSADRSLQSRWRRNQFVWTHIIARRLCITSRPLMTSYSITVADTLHQVTVEVRGPPTATTMTSCLVSRYRGKLPRRPRCQDQPAVKSGTVDESCQPMTARRADLLRQAGSLWSVGLQGNVRYRLRRPMTLQEPSTLKTGRQTADDCQRGHRCSQCQRYQGRWASIHWTAVDGTAVPSAGMTCLMSPVLMEMDSSQSCLHRELLLSAVNSAWYVVCLLFVMIDCCWQVLAGARRSSAHSCSVMLKCRLLPTATVEKLQFILVPICHQSSPSMRSHKEASELLSSAMTCSQLINKL